MTAMTAPEVLPNMQTSDVDRDDKTNIMRLEPRHRATGRIAAADFVWSHRYMGCQMNGTRCSRQMGVS